MSRRRDWIAMIVTTVVLSLFVFVSTLMFGPAGFIGALLVSWSALAAIKRMHIGRTRSRRTAVGRIAVE
jgi:hypothetical protein